MRCRGAVVLMAAARGAVGCTTLIAASSDGSVMCSHSDDSGSDPDARLLVTAAADHDEGARRAIYGQPIGHIPQVRHTYARYSNTYGIMNEKQVAMGETTCSGVFGTNAAGHGGRALMSINSLSEIALERCATARCARRAVVVVVPPAAEEQREGKAAAAQQQRGGEED
eukprot:gene26556-28890_t